MSRAYDGPRYTVDRKIFDWKPEAVRTTLRMWGEGRSASEIGRAIGASRCAVISKLHRLNARDRYVAAYMVGGSEPTSSETPRPAAPPPRRAAFALAEFDPVIARAVTSWARSIDTSIHKKAQANG